MDHQESTAHDRPSVIPRSDIPISDAPEDAGFEVRPFESHRVLGSVIPPAGVSLAWTNASPGQEVEVRSRPTAGLLIVLQGRGELTGKIRRTVRQGDVITVPKEQPYGFTAIGPE